MGRDLGGLFSDMTVEPLVSVIIPCFNSGKTLHQSVNSILGQTHKSVEVIVVDDGSSDEETIEALNKVSQDVKVIRLESNQGLPSARNVGFCAASGEYVLFLDADDWYDFEAIELMLQHCPIDTDNFFVFSDISLEDSRQGILKRCYKPFSQLMTNSFPYSILLPKRFIRVESLYDPLLVSGLEDWDLNLRLIASNFLPIHVDSALFHYRVSSSGMFFSKTIDQFFQNWRYIRGKNLELYSLSHLYSCLKLEAAQFGFRKTLPALAMFLCSKLPFDHTLNGLLRIYLRLSRRS
jgi:glycosyltransferase involved in cell wall biosynthesis